MFKSVQAIFYFVNDVVAAAQWYSQLLNLPVKYFYVENEVRGASIDINGIFFNYRIQSTIKSMHLHILYT